MTSISNDPVNLDLNAIKDRSRLAFREEPCSLADEAEAQLCSAADVPILVAKVQQLADLLHRVTIDEMGGTPDLFWPRCEHDGGCHDPWECWDEAVTVALAGLPLDEGATT